jgi:hypothetical protein
MECPNCLTPWKCNGPHLEKLNENLYKTINGYFMFENKWVFVPLEKEFDQKELTDIIDTLNFLGGEKNHGNV